MKGQHRILDALFDALYAAVTNRQHWVLFRADAYYLSENDIHCFLTKGEAVQYRGAHAEKGKPYSLIYAPNVLSLYRQVEELKLFQHDSVTSKINRMNEQNFDYVKDNLKYLGFGEGLAGKLRDAMSRGEGSFQLTFETEIHKKAFAAVINFRKSDSTDHYFLNSYHATLQRSNGDIRDQAFYLNKGRGVTAKEAYNLLEGRAVYKELENREGHKYHAWLQIDFSARDKSNNHEVKQYHQAYGFDLTATLQKYAIREMQSPDQRDVLVASLQRGNLQAVTMEKEGGTARVYVEANPQYKAVSLYDEGFHRLSKEAVEQYQVAAKGINAGPPQQQVGEGKDRGAENVKEEKGVGSGLDRKGAKDLLLKKDGDGKKGIKLK